MIKIQSVYSKDKYYEIEHYGCCRFIATKDEFKVSYSPYNEAYADMICPVCGKQFYGGFKPVNPPADLAETEKKEYEDSLFHRGEEHLKEKALKAFDKTMEMISLTSSPLFEPSADYKKQFQNYLDN